MFVSPDVSRISGKLSLGPSEHSLVCVLMVAVDWDLSTCLPGFPLRLGPPYMAAVPQGRVLRERLTPVDWGHSGTPSSHPLPLGQLVPMRGGNSHLYKEGSRKVYAEGKFT